MHKELIGTTEFSFGIIDNPNQLQDAFRLRFQVYCRECQFIKEEDYPQELEEDKFDPHSIEFFAQDSQEMIGTARLVLDSPLGLPLEEHCQDVSIDKEIRKNCAEISRLVISKQLRRRKNDGMYYSAECMDLKGLIAEKENLIKRVKPMTFGMFKEMYQESKRRDIRYWYVLMEKSLYLLLKIHGFIFNPIGEEINFYGPVRPYLASIEEVERNVLQKFPHLYNYFTEELELQYRPVNS